MILTEEAKVAGDFLAEVCTNWEAEFQKATVIGVRILSLSIGIVFEEGEEHWKR
ncbi:MAG: hypothetical protein ABJ387_12010 [Balneola sp.]